MLFVDRIATVEDLTWERGGYWVQAEPQDGYAWLLHVMPCLYGCHVINPSSCEQCRARCRLAVGEAVVGGVPQAVGDAESTYSEFMVEARMIP